ncbi:pirin family protein [Anoxynatronum sibiricum]|uniref:Pirin family protein n=1 Tax=Anoxynatronum sibiricum TaxID=210623 RepID=A0ABU9VS01_9CLOT
MNPYRSVKKVVRGRDASDGAGVKLVRVFSNRDAADFDPFLMMDAFDNDKPEEYVKGFPWHPHRGIETITYLLEGNVEHGDSLGNKGNIYDGDCQWMTAGSGIIHQEMPQPPGRMVGVQIWLNLPAKDKMTTPAYGDILSKNVPLLEDQGCDVRVIAGDYRGTSGAFEGRYIKPRFIDVTMPPQSIWVLDTEPDNTLYTYIFSGEGCFDPDSGENTGAKTTLLFEDGRQLKVTTGEKPLRFILLSGPRLNEPIAWGGPIVMNTSEELDQAFQDLDEGTFIKERI